MRELSNPSGDGIPLVSFAIGRGYTGFFWGILLREINERYHFDRLRIIPLVTGAWSIVFILMFLYREHYIGDDLWNILCFMVFPAVVLFFGHQNVEKYFSVTLFKNVGDVTLHVFVWHYPVLLAVLILSKYTYLNFNSIVAMLLTTMIIFLVGILSYIFYVNMSKVPWSIQWKKNLE